MQAIGRFLKNSKQDMDAARKLLTQAQVDLEKVQDSAGLAGLATSPAPGFLPKINSNRMGPAPPRPVRLLSPQQSRRHFENLIDELLQTCDVVKVMASHMYAFSQGRGSLQGISRLQLCTVTLMPCVELLLLYACNKLKDHMKISQANYCFYSAAGFLDGLEGICGLLLSDRIWAHSKICCGKYPSTL